MTKVRLILVLAIIFMAGAVIGAQAFSPIATISVTLPDGQTKELAVPEGGVGKVTAHGVEYEVQPIILDSKPWNRVNVRIFKVATDKAPTELIGEIEVTTGAPAAASKTTPSFRIAVIKVSSPATLTN